MKKIFFKSMLLLCALIVGSGDLWADDITLTASSGFTSSYSSNHTMTISEKGFKDNGVMYNGKGSPNGFAVKQVIQLRKSGNSGAGTIYNTTAISTITTVEVTLVSNNNGFSIFYGTSEEPSTNSIASSSLTPVTGSFSYTNTDGGTSSTTSYKYTFDLSSYSATYIRIVNGGSANYVGSIVINYEVAPAFTITPTVNTAAMGGVDISGTTITASPNEGYRVKAGNAGYTVTAGSASVSHEGYSNTLTVTPSTDCTVCVNFEETPSHTASFVINGTTLNYSYREGANIDFADDIPAIGGKAFVGWVSTPIDEPTDEEPTFITSATMGTTNVTYYAVFASEDVAYEWHKETDLSKIGAGVYALITTDGHAFNGTISSGHGQATTNAFSFNNNGVATSAPSGTCEITLAAITHGYSMYNSNKGYLYAAAASSGNLAWDTKTPAAWSYASSNWQDYNTNAHLRSYNNSSFRTYGTNNGAILAFAKKVAVASYSGYCTSIDLTFTAQTPKTLVANDASGYWATFSDASNVTFFPENHSTDVTTLYTVDVEESTLSLHALSATEATIESSTVNGYFVPANTGVLIKCTGNSVPYYTVENKYVAPLSNNMLLPGKGTTTTANVASLFYLLGIDNEKVGFYWGEANGAAFTARNGGAYLAVPTGDNNAPARYWITDEENNATNIENVEANEKAVTFFENGQIYILRDGVVYDTLGRKIR